MRSVLIPMFSPWQFPALLQAHWQKLPLFQFIKAKFLQYFRLEAALVWILTGVASLVIVTEFLFNEYDHLGFELGILGFLFATACLTLTRWYRPATQFVLIIFSVSPILNVLYIPEATFSLSFMTFGILLSSLCQPNRFTLALVVGDTVAIVGLLVVQPYADARSVITALYFVVGVSALVLVSNVLRAQTRRHLDELEQQAAEQRLNAAIEHERNLKLEQQAEAQRLEAALTQERALTLQRLIRESSHDMKAPLSTLNITLHLLNKFAEDPERRTRYADNLQLQVQHLVEIIDTMKKLAQDESLADTRPVRTGEFAALGKISTDDSLPTRPAPLEKQPADENWDDCPDANSA